MLIEKNMAPKEGDVVALRLLTGEEVIGKAVSLTPTTIALARPLILQMQMVGPQQAGLAFVPFMMAADEDQRVTFHLDRLAVAPIKVRQEIAAQYVRSTSGLAIPSGPAGPSSLIGG
jgi:hypothetical protein